MGFIIQTTTIHITSGGDHPVPLGYGFHWRKLLESPRSQKPMPPTTRRIFGGVFASESSIIWGVLKMILGESLGLIRLICGGPAIV